MNPPNPFIPGYLNLHRTGELKVRAEEAVNRLASCAICAQACNVNRLEGEIGAWVYLQDQQAAGVGVAKVAKRLAEAAMLEEAGA